MSLQAARDRRDLVATPLIKGSCTVPKLTVGRGLEEAGDPRVS
jgi:hypothetical protein